MIILTTEEKLTWFNNHGYKTEYKELPFTFEHGEDRGFIKSHIVTKMKNVPTVQGLNVCDDYNKYIKNFDSFFADKFKEYIINL